MKAIAPAILAATLLCGCKSLIGLTEQEREESRLRFLHDSMPPRPTQSVPVTVNPPLVSAEALERRRQQQRRKTFIEENPNLPDGIESLINNGTVQIDMAADQVKASWGDPTRINRHVTRHGSSEQWVYGRTYLYFDGGKLASWSDSR